MYVKLGISTIEPAGIELTLSRAKERGATNHIAVRAAAKPGLTNPGLRTDYPALEQHFTLASALIGGRSQAGTT